MMKEQRLLHQCLLILVFCLLLKNKKEKTQQRAIWKEKNILHSPNFVRKRDIKKTHQLADFKHNAKNNTEKSCVNISGDDQEDLLF